jgi:3-methylcrotonyl-CoA carboxylase alpha subunit
MMFERLLIANRGEIACRIVRTARRLGVTSIAVYSETDAGSLHVAEADEAWPIGGSSARESYLNIAKLIETAQRAGAQAVHPGYGFLSENYEFAVACSRAGLMFIGPSPQAIRIMGSKASAKSLMESIGAPVVPGYHRDATDTESLISAAKNIGFPLLVKASAGGGGRGMRIAFSLAQLPEAIASAEREAVASFGDGRLLIEKYLDRSRHVEVQIFGDSKGRFVSFLERDCSMQRRRQKILEETPAPLLPTSLGLKMRETAITAAKTMGYVGAGTVEFLVQDGAYYFLEMNTRLQVEHPVTEMIAGQDLVEWQLRIACGEDLPLSQDLLTMQGSAIEVRICAENPAQNFLPSVGLIDHFRPPEQIEGVRVDSGVRCGDRITQFYDSLIAKLVVWGSDRAEALRRLQSALASFELTGVKTNLDFLRAIAKNASFRDGDYDTAFVERNIADLLTASQIAANPMMIVAAGAAMWLDELRRREVKLASNAGEETSPWAAADGWRILGKGAYALRFNSEKRELETKIQPTAGRAFRMDFEGRSAFVEFDRRDERFSLRIDGLKVDAAIVSRAEGLVVILDGKNYDLDYVGLLESSLDETNDDSQIRSPLPARVVRLNVRPGDRVTRGTNLIVLEAMKMEIVLSAPRDGVVERVTCAEGDMMTEGTDLVLLKDGELE